jgi:SOS-response transcriptional repressor LexA
MYCNATCAVGRAWGTLRGMSEITRRIRERRQALGISQTELGRRAGVTLKQVWKWEVGRDVPSAVRIESIAAALGVSPDWLLRGEEIHYRGASGFAKMEMKMYELQQEFDRLRYRTPLPASKPIKTGEVEQGAVPAMHELPVLANIAANYQLAYAQSKELEQVEANFAKKNHYCLLVRGQSMRPNIYEGDVLVVESVNYLLEPYEEARGPADKRLWKSLKGEIVCAMVDDDEPVLKRMRISDRRDTGFKIVLQGDNPASEPIEITKEQRLRVVGIVRRILRDPRNTG